MRKQGNNPCESGLVPEITRAGVLVQGNFVVFFTRKSCQMLLRAA
jgi:hypothetical protein